MLVGQDWYNSPWRYEASTYKTELWPSHFKYSKGTSDILVNILVAGP